MRSARERLLEAMAALASGEGYAAAGAARVAARAGVSRATFYRHFGSREECFLEAHRRACERVGELLAEVRRRRQRETAEAGLRRLLEGLAGDAAFARLVLLAPHTAGKGGMRRLLELDVATWDVLRELGPETVLMPRVALTGGTAHMAGTRLLGGEPAVLPALAPDLARCLAAYSGAAEDPDAVGQCLRRWGSRFPYLRPESRVALTPRALPRGRNALPAPAAAASRRERILAATEHVVGARGYSAASVTEIVAVAHTTRASFYAHFGGKREAFLAVQEAGLRESIAVAAAAFAAAATWPEQVWEGLGALLAFAARRPAMARLALLEPSTAGPTALRRDRENRMAFVLFLADGYKHAPAAANLPDLCSEVIAGAIQALMRRQLLRDPACMLEALPAAAYVALAPFLGPADALRFVEERSPAVR